MVNCLLRGIYIFLLSLLSVNRCLLPVGLLLPLTVLGIVSWEVTYIALAIEDKQVVDNLVHEVAVVAHHDDTPGKVSQILLEHL